MPLSISAELGLTNRFQVVVDGIDLGGWSNCDGLGVKFGIKSIKEGGVNDYVVLLPERIDYPQITLKRAMNSKDSQKVQDWLKDAVRQWIHGTIPDYRTTGYPGATAQITLLDQHQAPVLSWSLRNVFPAEWAAPGMDASSAKVALETLKLAHEGFL